MIVLLFVCGLNALAVNRYTEFSLVAENSRIYQCYCPSYSASYIQILKTFQISDHKHFKKLQDCWCKKQSPLFKRTCNNLEPDVQKEVDPEIPVPKPETVASASNMVDQSLVKAKIETKELCTVADLRITEVNDNTVELYLATNLEILKKFETSEPLSWSTTAEQLFNTEIQTSIERMYQELQDFFKVRMTFELLTSDFVPSSHLPTAQRLNLLMRMKTYAPNQMNTKSFWFPIEAKGYTKLSKISSVGIENEHFMNVVYPAVEKAGQDLQKSIEVLEQLLKNPIKSSWIKKPEEKFFTMMFKKYDNAQVQTVLENLKKLQSAEEIVFVKSIPREGGTQAFTFSEDVIKQNFPELSNQVVLFIPENSHFFHPLTKTTRSIQINHELTHYLFNTDDIPGGYADIDLKHNPERIVPKLTTIAASPPKNGPGEPGSYLTAENSLINADTYAHFVYLISGGEHV